jgi:hypothetical protein
MAAGGARGADRLAASGPLAQRRPVGPLLIVGAGAGGAEGQEQRRDAGEDILGPAWAHRRAG